MEDVRENAKNVAENVMDVVAGMIDDPSIPVYIRQRLIANYLEAARLMTAAADAKERGEVKK